MGMRIIKSQAMAVLDAENKLLDAQKTRCVQQAQNLENLSLAGLKGDAAESLGLRTKAQAAILNEHLAFYDSLAGANRANLGLVRALPETSPGVLDTVAAQDRLLEAKERLGSLEQEMTTAMSKAEEANKSARNAMGIPAPGYNAPPEIRVDTYTIRQNYESLMRVQQIAAHENQEILEKAQQYEQASQRLYQSVEATHLWKSIGLCNHYANGRIAEAASLSDSERSALLLAVAGLSEEAVRAQKKAGVVADVEALVADIADDGIEGAWSAQDVYAEASADVLGMAATGEVSASFLGISGSVKPYGKAKTETGDETETTISVGVSAEADAYVLKEKVSGSWGAAHGSAEVSLLTGAVCGEVGASFDPTTGEFKAGFKAEAEGSVLEVEGNARIGEDDYNVHAHVDGKVLTASAKANLTISNEGIEAKAGAEAYVFTGEAVGGFTFMGITVDAVGEAKIGGAGAMAQLQTDANGMELDLGLGLLLGVGTKVKIDWSGFPAAWDNAMNNVESWWNDNMEQLDRLFSHGGGGSHRF